MINRGVAEHCFFVTFYYSPAISVIPCLFKLLRTLLHIFALKKDTTFLFSGSSALFDEKHPGWWCQLFRRCPGWRERIQDPA
jgi:hypothetical protein